MKQTIRSQSVLCDLNCRLHAFLLSATIWTETHQCDAHAMQDCGRWFTAFGKVLSDYCVSAASPTILQRQLWAPGGCGKQTFPF